MITAIDTNILIDIFGADPKFGELSVQLLKRCVQEGAIQACEIVWTETATVFGDQNTFLEAIQTLGIEFSPMTEEAALLAAEAWRLYRKKGGKRDRVVADFLIAAHAKTQCDRLLTRDRGFYRNYFESLIVVDPTKTS
ncbi:MAG: type II toxin-antitoxin system VapC family toxin [Proteobacteria bacterium]|nr:type II toxin-antitoxin system VapC family toxin [Pseudomonadota bacterium]